ncbi:toll/interleukin-1 receptor domain-containing protein [Priestia aryabhattai]|uniref:toll/interleukin-1 receptor domain-containing protein n=1 Tax=Priestia aryabhattai TaxID=412384 RepID=UPI001CFEF72F|nr:toll/interleukin-1 receptor domain-containing protein [Priestia aryabhattai]
MDQSFIIEFDYFKSRNFIFYLLSKIESEQSRNRLTGYHVFINNIPTSLEFYVFLSYEGNSKDEINKMKELLFPVGTYRPDLSLEELMNRLSKRGFNSFSLDPYSIPLILIGGFVYNTPSDLPPESLFTEEYLQRLKQKGYDAFEKLPKGTTLFLSHSSKQKEDVENIIPYFNSKDELIWLDKYRLERNEDIHVVKREIAIGLNEASKVFFYVTKEFLESYWCNHELELSLQIYKEKPNYTFLFAIELEIKEKFNEKYLHLIEKIQEKDILILYTNQNLESIIKSHLLNEVPNFK